MKRKSDFKSGFVSIIGAPNVGKSTLLNTLLGEKLSITSAKPQTTRNRITGILNREGMQIIFTDTPGIHRAKKPLNMRIVTAALSVVGDGDLALVMVDASRPDAGSEEILLNGLRKSRKPALLAINKIDLIEKELLLPMIKRWTAEYDFEEVIPISAKRGENVENLVECIRSLLPSGHPFFPEDAITDQPVRFLAAEMIREKVFRLTGAEIPYSTAVVVESFKESKGDSLVGIEATICVERDSQKGILIGKRGEKIRKIGQAARQDIERMLGARVFLKLFVKVEKNWSRDPRAMRRFGY